MRTRAGFIQHEKDIQHRLGLSATVSSGNQFHDPGDAVDNNGDSAWPLYVECKYRERKSYAVGRDETDAWRRRAELWGKRFVLAVRFWEVRTGKATDYVLMPLSDFEELLDKAGLR